MTLDDVKTAIDEIKGLVSDHDTAEAHICEDKLYAALLQSIADGSCTNPAICAQEALRTKTIITERWFS